MLRDYITLLDLVSVSSDPSNHHELHGSVYCLHVFVYVCVCVYTRVCMHMHMSPFYMVHR